MVTRQTIKETFYSDLQSAVSGTLSSDRVSLFAPDIPEELPAITYDAQYRDMQVNGASSAPYRVEQDQSGNDVALYFHEYIEAQFTVRIHAADADESTKESLYESVRNEFGKYEHAQWDARDFHADVDFISTVDVTTAQATDSEQTVRTDALQVFVQFHDEYRYPESGSGDSIDTVDRTVNIN